MKLFRLKHQKIRGSSLIEVLVVTGIMSIVSLGVVNIVTDQNKQVKFISEKLLAKETEGVVKVVLAESSYCSCLFRGRTFNTTTGSWNTTPASLPISFTAVPAFPAACTAAGIDIVPPVGSAINASSMTVHTLAITDAVELVPGSGNYFANFEVGFNNSIRPMKSVKTAFSFSINPTGGGGATTRPFLSCAAGGAPSVWTKNADNSIFYNTANVGIGTNTPRTKLDVNGAIFPGDTTQVCDSTILGALRSVTSGGFAPQAELQQCRRLGINATDPLGWAPVTPPKTFTAVSTQSGYNPSGNYAGDSQISVPSKPGYTYVLDVSAYFCGTNDTDPILVTDNVASTRIVNMRKDSNIPGCDYMTLTSDTMYIGPTGALGLVFTLQLPAGITAKHIRWRVVSHTYY